MPQAQKPKPFQFSLKSLFLLTTGCAVYFALIKFLGLWLVLLPLSLLVFFLFVKYAIVRQGRRAVRMLASINSDPLPKRLIIAAAWTGYLVPMFLAAIPAFIFSVSVPFFLEWQNYGASTQVLLNECIWYLLFFLRWFLFILLNTLFMAVSAAFFSSIFLSLKNLFPKQKVRFPLYLELQILFFGALCGMGTIWQLDLLSSLIYGSSLSRNISAISFVWAFVSGFGFSILWWHTDEFRAKEKIAEYQVHDTDLNKFDPELANNTGPVQIKTRVPKTKKISSPFDKDDSDA